MSTLKTESTSLKYHTDAYRFIDSALRFTQKRLNRQSSGNDELDDEGAHISGPELLDGVRELALQEFGLMTILVFQHWGVRSTDDFGRIVFDFIERGAMRKTEQDQVTDFFAVYDFEEVFDRDFRIDLSEAFRE